MGMKFRQHIVDAYFNLLPLLILHMTIQRHVSEVVDVFHQIFPNLLLGAMQINEGNFFLNMKIFTTEALHHVFPSSDGPSG